MLEQETSAGNGSQWGVAERHRFSETVGLIYDSAIDASVWNNALKNLSTYIPGTTWANLSVYDPTARSVRLVIDHGIDPHWLKLHQEKYEQMMPLFHVMPKVDLDRPMNLKRILEFVPVDERQQMIDHPYFTEFARPAGLNDIASAIIWREPNRLAAFSIYTSPNREWVTDEELDLFSLFVPHVKRAVMIGDLLNLKSLGETAFDQVLNGMGHAALVLDRNSKILFCNTRAKEMLDDKSIIRSTAGKFHASFAMAQSALAKALQLAERDEATIGRSGIGIPLARQPVPAMAYVLPLARRAAIQGWSDEASAVVLIKTTEIGPPTQTESLAALFALTPTEARVAVAIARSPSRAEAAQHLDMSVETIKTHLSRIFDKTGCADQQELALMLERIAPPG